MYAAALIRAGQPLLPPKEEAPPFLNFSPLENAENVLDRSAQRYAKALKSLQTATSQPSPFRR